MKLKKMLAGFMTLAMLVTTLPATVLAADESADLTISTVEELKEFAETVNEGNNYSGKTVVLGADLDLENEEWTPIGYEGKTFKGTFDGNEHKISNLTITKELDNTAANNGIGLFGRTDSSAVIKNLTIENVDITGSLYVGAIVGLGYTGSEIVNCTVKGDIEIDAWWYAGGIGGNGYLNTVKDCDVIGDDGSYIKGNDGSYIGGIWGFRGEGNNKIIDCTVENLDIIGVDRVGAICGIGHYGNTITGCTADEVTVTATDEDATTVGSIVGACQGTEASPTNLKDNNVSGVTVYVGDTEINSRYGTNINGDSCEVGTHVKIEVATIDGEGYESLEDAIEAAENGDTITLLADVTLPDSADIAKDIEINLNDNTMTVTGDHNLNGNITIKNGTLDVTGANADGDGIITIGSRNEADVTLTLDDVDVTGDGYNSAYAVFYVYTTATLDVKNNSTMTLSNESSSLGGVIKAQTAEGVINITDSELNFTDTVRGVQSGIVTIKDSKVIIKGTAQTADKLDNAFNSESGLKLTFDNTEVNISNGAGRGITLMKADDAVTIKGGSVVTIKDMAEASIRFKDGAGILTVEDCTYATNPEGCLIVETILDDDGENSLDVVKTHFKLPSCWTLEENGDTTDKMFVLTHGEDHEKPAEPTPSKNKTKKYDVIIKNADNGDVEVDDDYAKRGQEITITVDPDKGYELDELTITDQYGDELDYEEGKKENTFVFDMPKSDVTIEASFDKESSSAADKDDEEVVDKDEEDEDASAGDGEQEYIRLTIGQKIAWVFDEYVVNDVAPEIRNERTMLPIRFVAEALGATVTWNEAEQKVTITEDDLVIEIFIGQPFATVNGEPVELDAPAYIANDRTYLPLRFVAENLGATVIWDGTAQTVTIFPVK